MEVGKRMGAKHDNLTEAIIQAIDAWKKTKGKQKLMKKEDE